jgi:hypothetical protein
MGITESGDGRRDGKSSGNDDSSSKQSFGNFCVSALLQPETLSNPRNDEGNNDTGGIRLWQQKPRAAFASTVKNVANSYISGEAMEGPVHALFESLETIICQSIGIENPSLPPSTMRSYPYQKDDLETFHKDLLGCLENKLLHEYVSSSWESVDHLVRVNQRKKKGRNTAGVCVGSFANGIETSASMTDNVDAWGDQCEGRLSALVHWYHSRKTHFWNKILASAGNGSDEVKKRHGSDIENHARGRKRCRPTVYFLGGGMGAGKSTVVSYLKETGDKVFQNDPIVDEADAFRSFAPSMPAGKRASDSGEASMATAATARSCNRFMSIPPMQPTSYSWRHWLASVTWWLMGP